MPALLISTSNGPRRLSASATAEAADPSSETSQAMEMALPPPASIAAVSSRPVFDLATRATDAPAPAIALANPRPSPLLAPVIITTCPLMSIG